MVKSHSREMGLGFVSEAEYGGRGEGDPKIESI